MMILTIHSTLHSHSTPAGQNSLQADFLQGETVTAAR